MHSSVTVCDTDSESEFSNFCKKPLYVSVRRRKSKSKNKLQDVQKRRRCTHLCGLLLAIAIVTILFVATCIRINDTSENASLKMKKSILVLNWHNEEVPLHSSINCTVSVVNSARPAITVEQYNSYDAIIMNSTAANVLLGIESINLYNDSQLLIFATQNPLNYPNTISLPRSYFRVYDKSLSYSLTSDFVWQPFEIVRRRDLKVVAPSLQPEWDVAQNQFHEESNREFFLNEVKETSPLALTVLDRPCQEARQELVWRIMENMDVHTYGECGKFNCANVDQCLSRTINKQGNKAYKFYLAFEEELCVDYVGEKFYKALNARLLPIVFGAANYNRFAPPQSFINARDYASVRELTEYLFYLDQNPEELIKYFTWHETYMLRRSHMNMDKICDYLQSEDRRNFTHSKLETAEPIVNWLEENKCLPYELSDTMWLA